MDYKFSDLVQIEKLEDILSNFSSVTDLPVAIADAEGNYIIGIGFQEICKEFHRKNSQSEARCKNSDACIKHRLRESEVMDNKCIIYKCENGLTDMAAPIIIEGKHLATFLIGQFLLEEPDENCFKAQAAKFGFDEQSYLHSLKKVPVYNKEKATKIMNFCTDFAELLTTLGLKNLREKENNDRNKQLEEYRTKMEKIESIGFLAGGIAHDFNNILTAALGNISLIRYKLKQEKNNDDKVLQYLDEAENSLYESKNLTQQLLTFAKGGSPIFKTICIKQLLKESATFTLRGTKVNCNFNMAEDLLPVEVDKSQISQVINNLIINATQAMPDGGTIYIVAENVTINNREKIMPLVDGKYVKISITDQGVGIPKRLLNKIFDPYFTTKKRGNGLGLATSHSIITKHNGYLTVDSQVGKGSTFTFYLKASLNEIIEQAKDNNPPITGSGRILVMDDQASIREVLTNTLTALGFEVECATEGDEALVLLQQRKFVAAILDLTIPGAKGGKEIIDEIKRISPNITAIVSSGYNNSPVMSNYAHYGFDNVLAKPFNLQDLEEVLKDI